MAEGKEFLLNDDRARGIRVIGWWEPGDPRLHVRVEQEIPDELFTHNHELAADNTKHDRRRKNKVLVARVPQLMKQQWLQEINLNAGLLTDEENPEVERLIKRKLNDIDYRKLRTGGGRV
jgi:hypothetical protein